MSGLTREEIELAALVLIVDEGGIYRWSSSEGHPRLDVANLLRGIANDLVLAELTGAEPDHAARVIGDWEARTQSDLSELVTDVVLHLRSRDISFAVIGRGFGVSRQAAWERFTNLLKRREAQETATEADHG